MNNNINDNNIRRCYNCNDEINEGDNIYIDCNGNEICEGCRDNEYFECDNCGELVHNDYARGIWRDGHSNEESIWCDDCFESEAMTCRYCGEYFANDSCGYYTHDDSWACDRCIEEHYHYCDRCNEYFPQGECEYCESDECYYCEDCAREVNEEQDNTNIYGYHTFSSWRPYRTQKEKDYIEKMQHDSKEIDYLDRYLIGFELEIDNDDSYDIKEVHDLITSNINSVLMHDGSLSYRGIEIVSHPQSFDYIMEQYDKYDLLFNKLRNDYGFTSHDNGRCGLHFHITRPNDEIVNRIMLIIETFKDELLVFSRRDKSSQKRWSQFYSDWKENSYSVNQTGIKGEELSIKFIDDNKKMTNRYMVLNNTNKNTIEFRLIRGTLNTETFFASLELINNIVRVASDLSIPLDTINWNKITNTPYCKKYCEEKNINSDRIVIDMTPKIQDIINLVCIEKGKIDNLLDSYLKYVIKNNKTLFNNITIDNIEDVYDGVSKMLNFKNKMLRNGGIRLFENLSAQEYINFIKSLNSEVYNNYYHNRINKKIKEVTKLCA